MKITMKKWEIVRIKEVISDVLHLWAYDIISAKSKSGAEISMSIETFMEQLEKELNQ